ncbi:MAG: hypothetical protein IJL92_07505, partial [Thermoguttaceae bacterium]|nr:hypothetical protein [Thermoguttaceae bacterium]
MSEHDDNPRGLRSVGRRLLSVFSRSDARKPAEKRAEKRAEKPAETTPNAVVESPAARVATPNVWQLLYAKAEPGDDWSQPGDEEALAKGSADSRANRFATVFLAAEDFARTSGSVLQANKRIVSTFVLALDALETLIPANAFTNVQLRTLRRVLPASLFTQRALACCLAANDKPAAKKTLLRYTKLMESLEPKPEPELDATSEPKHVVYTFVQNACKREEARSVEEILAIADDISYTLYRQKEESVEDYLALADEEIEEASENKDDDIFTSDEASNQHDVDAPLALLRAPCTNETKDGKTPAFLRKDLESPQVPETKAERDEEQLTPPPAESRLGEPENVPEKEDAPDVDSADAEPEHKRDTTQEEKSESRKLALEAVGRLVDDLFASDYVLLYYSKLWERKQSVFRNAGVTSVREIRAAIRKVRPQYDTQKEYVQSDKETFVDFDDAARRQLELRWGNEKVTTLSKLAKDLYVPRNLIRQTLKLNSEFQSTGGKAYAFENFDKVSAQEQEQPVGSAATDASLPADSSILDTPPTAAAATLESNAEEPTEPGVELESAASSKTEDESEEPDKDNGDFTSDEASDRHDVDALLALLRAPCTNETKDGETPAFLRKDLESPQVPETKAERDEEQLTPPPPGLRIDEPENVPERNGASDEKSEDFDEADADPELAPESDERRLRRRIRERFAGADEASYMEIFAFVRDELHTTLNKARLALSVNDFMSRVSVDRFVADRFVRFDVDRIDARIERILHEAGTEYLALKGFADKLADFPPCGHEWNLFVLETFVRRFSEKFRLMTHEPNSVNVGIVVNRYSLWSTERQILRDAIVRDSVPTVAASIDVDQIHAWLVEKGYRFKRDEELLAEFLDYCEKFGVLPP